MSICYTATRVQDQDRETARRGAAGAHARVLRLAVLKVRVVSDGVTPKYASANDVALMADGDSAAFRRIYDAYVGLLKFVALRHGLAREEADEVVQETFLKLYTRVSDVRDPGKVKSWLVATVRNLAVDRLRARKRQAKGAAPDVIEGVQETLWTGGTSATREAELSLVRELVERIALHPGGETFRMFYIEGRSANEIALANGEAISTVTTRLSRLREKFRAELLEHIEALRSRAIGP